MNRALFATRDTHRGVTFEFSKPEQLDEFVKNNPELEFIFCGALMEGESK